MTREEIENTHKILDCMLSECIIAESRKKLLKRLEEICKLAIKELEQEPKTDILDKIRAEIEELYSYVEFDEDLKTSFNMIRLEDVQKVLDKYKAKSEE